MQIIIESKNKTEFCRPDIKEMDNRRFFMKHGQLYRGYPEQFARMRIRHFGAEVGTDEVIVYQENCIHPQVELGTRITKDKILADIDANKEMTSGVVMKRPWGKLSSKSRKSLANLAPFLLIGGVLLYAIITNGGL